MLAAGPEKNRHAKGDDSAEADPPWKFHHRQPAWLGIKFAAKNSGDVVGKTTQDRNDYKADDHGNNVAEVVAALPGENSAEKDPEQRAISVAENSEHDRNDADVRMHDNQVGSCRRHNDHQD